MIGPTFGAEVIEAGLGGLPFTWGDDGSFSGRENLTSDQNAKLDAVIAAHDPSKTPPRQIVKSLVLSRLTDTQLDNALALMNNRQKERWRAPDHPSVDVDDPDLLAVLKAIGADPAAVLA